MGNNEIEEIENISHLSELEEFWVSLHIPLPCSIVYPCGCGRRGTRGKEAKAQASGNKISNLRALDTQLAHLSKLETVYLEHNPCQRNDITGYRRKIMLALPQLKQIDATYVR